VLLRAALLVARKSLRRHRLAGSITVFSIALAVAVLLMVSSLQTQAVKVMAGQTGGFDGVLGARGSPLQLVLSTFYHLENSPGNLSWEDYLAIRANPAVRLAMPVAFGDHYRGFRLVGTLPEYARAWGLELAQGQNFAGEGEAVVGSWVAEQSGLKLGDRFHPAHGFSGDSEHQESYRVVGILKPSNSPQDRILLIPLEGVYRMSGHVLRGHGQDYTPVAGQPIADEHKELSGVLLKLSSPQAGMSLEESINRKGHSATLAWPVARVVGELFGKLGWALKLLQVTNLLVLLVACASVTASLCNTLQERRREFAILRALGARRWFVAGVVALESLWLCLLGTFGGFCLNFLGLWLAADWLRAQSGLHFSPWAAHPAQLWVPLGAVLLGALSGSLPTWLVYRQDLAGELNSGG
jgi:putative ABC transport system permease protein